ncbi:carbohydrate kinase family protein [Glutamicibacter nicotianae]|uniref:carbohydrate kinase family protein n=1 Tax=Glutamicibacter nicotianae TaxID=37929 RepID=UPI0019585CB6|nr:carbohydrate kinase [Glutamicibacter nicotianae]MBM7769062.1 fructokinase [Glutamicibacter nicotianae]
MSHIEVMGESLVDVVGGTAHPGGSPLNVAVGLARLGHEVHFSTEFGRDTYGNQIDEHLQNAGVKVIAGSVTERSTSVAQVEMDELSNAHYTFDIHQQIPAMQADDATELLHTGSIAAWIEPSSQCIVDAFMNASVHSLRSYDPNLRPDLVQEKDSAVERIEQLMSLSNIVKLSDVDGQWLYPELEAWEVLEHIASLGPGLVVMTQGADGCLALTSGRRIDIEASPTTLVDTIGAGDAFMSGLLYGVLANPELALALRSGTTADSKDVEVALRHALTSAALTVAQAGANPPWIEDFSLAINNYASQH